MHEVPDRTRGWVTAVVASLVVALVLVPPLLTWSGRSAGSSDVGTARRRRSRGSERRHRVRSGVMPMNGVSDRLLEALSALEGVANEVTADEAATCLDDAALQVFWRSWPRVGSWAGALWRRLDADLAIPASSVTDPDVDEVGGEGG